VAGARSYTLAWGLPSAALVAAVFMAPATRTLVWTGALAWMGLACLANALRCGRLHCYLTGPFFLFMAGASLLHGLGILWLGPRGWLWLGLTIVVGGFGLLWYLPERLWGKYARRG
jgi:hypothetical protein